VAVYTQISQKEISSIQSNFNLEKIVNFKGIKQGIENTNYFLITKKNKYVLTIFEKRVKKSELPFFMKLMDKLNHKGISCPRPLKNKKGNYLFRLKNKLACISTIVEGKDKKNLTPRQCLAVGQNIGKLHKSSFNIRLFRKNSFQGNKLDSLYKSIKFKTRRIAPNLETVLGYSRKNIKQNWPKNLPAGIIHADLFIDNIFFKKNKFSGFIDFYFSCNDFLIYELAICINALCFDYKKGKYNLNKSKVLNLIKGYEKVRRISINEKNSLNILCRAAALRYLLTRIYDYFNTPKTALIKVKDPKEYFQKLIIHNKLTNYKDYFN
jgi:homoserine kinase type II